MFEKTFEKIEIFKDLSPKQIDELYGWIERRDYKAGEEIIRQGQIPNGLYVLTAGTVGVVKSSERGKVKVTEIKAPSFFGEIGVLNGRARTARVRAETAVMVGYIPLKLFSIKLSEDNTTAFRISLNIGRILCNRLVDTTDLLANTVMLANSDSKRT